MGDVIGSFRQAHHVPFDVQTLPEYMFIRESINTNDVVIFSKTYCPFSDLAKEQFRKLSVKTFNIELDTREDGHAIQNVLRKITGCSTIPQVFVYGQFIGGGTATEQLYNDGALQKFFQLISNQTR